ncbi:MAG: hypothetical protein JWP68_3218 [Modestobacter sp.]|jgi:hypothetical protein|nr:hypothetical protein [Modestobacter sp.]MCW2510070.1 hypothetical protein [Modestobacter sp.]MCW2575042.1 hypothetical protein [Modestobacter sp.]
MASRAASALRCKLRYRNTQSFQFAGADDLQHDDRAGHQPATEGCPSLPSRSRKPACANSSSRSCRDRLASRMARKP